MRHAGIWPLKYESLDLTTPDGAHLYGLRLGHGPVPLLVIPGAGDGVTHAEDAARLLAWHFRSRWERYRLLYLSRREPIPHGYTVAQHADDYLWALDHLGWGPGLVECNSGGGPIGQLVAARRPDLVAGLVLSCTFHRTAPETRRVLEAWIEFAERREWGAFSWDSVVKTFRPATITRYRPFRALLALRRPKNPERVVRVLEGLLGVDHREVLPRIGCPTLVVGGEDDRVIPASVQREMASLLPDGRLILYPGYGHGNDQENPDYQRQLDLFAQQVTFS